MQRRRIGQGNDRHRRQASEGYPAGKGQPTGSGKHSKIRLLPGIPAEAKVDIISVRKEAMKKILSGIGYVLITIAMVDIIVVLFTMLQIGNGGYTPHISFWDEQIKVIVSVLK